MERSCVRTCWPFARAAVGCRRAGQAPRAVKGNISANVGTRYGVDLVSPQRGIRWLQRGGKDVVLHSSSGWNEEINWVITELTELCEVWLQQPQAKKGESRP